MSVWTPPRSQAGTSSGDDGGLRVRFVPLPELLVAVILGSVTLVGPFLGPHFPEWLAIAVAAGFVRLYPALLVVTWSGSLELTGRIRSTRLFGQVESPLDAVRYVHIQREHIRDWVVLYVLVFEYKGELLEHPFARHWLWGGRAMRQARRVAEYLDVEIRDDRAGFWDDPWYYPWGWMSYLFRNGHEWAFYLILTLPTLYVLDTC